ncbi:MAG: M50 family metallopeptidase [Alphaproteobacteria bacterium]|nr:M50 family metallopeptidase [Alphaproteobacteria bacterium]
MGAVALRKAAEDLLQRPLPPSKHLARRRVVVALVVAVALADSWLGLGILSPLLRFLQPKTVSLGFPGGLVAFLCAAWLAVLVHELGHAIGGVISGWRVEAIAVWPFVVRIRPFRVQTYFRGASAEFGGFVRGVPPDARPRYADFLFNAGGIITNIVAWLIARDWALDHPHLLSGSLAAVFGFVNVWVAIGNAIPFELDSGGASDGRHILQLIRGRAAQGIGAVGRLAMFAQDGVRPRDWPQSLVEAAEAASPEDRCTGYAAMLLSGRYMDEGRIADAHTAMLECLKADPPSSVLKWHFIAGAAWFAARYERDAEAATGMLALLPDSFPGGDYVVERARAAVHAVNGEWSDALICATKARALVAKLGVKLAADDLEELDEIAAQAAAKPSRTGSVPAFARG